MVKLSHLTSGFAGNAVQDGDMKILLREKDGFGCGSSVSGADSSGVQWAQNWRDLSGTSGGEAASAEAWVHQAAEGDGISLLYMPE